MNWWQWALIGLGSIIGFLLLLLVLDVGLWLSLVVGKFCKCGHGPAAHQGPNTECYGTTQVETNALGVNRHFGACPCVSFRQTDRSAWKRLTDQFGEAQA